MANKSSDKQAVELQGQNRDLKNTVNFLYALAAFGLVAVFALALNRSTVGDWISGLAFGWLLLAGASLVGGVLGLLFGIPKSVSDPAASRPPNGEKESERSARAAYAVNTNLEQISDWLTKIIVGVGLTQIPAIQAGFSKLAVYFGNAIGSDPKIGPTIAAVILIYGLTAGFLAGYLMTRIFLPGAFNRADQQLREIKAQIVEETARFGKAITEVSKDLYRYDDKGFVSAITKLDGLLMSDTARSNPTLWAYLAAAHGQAWKWENKNRPDTDTKKAEVLKQHRDAALEAINKSIDISDDWKPILETMWDKNQKNKEEDDLEVFFDDNDFKKVFASGSN